ncbi:MAG: putative membrane protein YfcA [Pseudomonadales bacterium]
MELFGFSVEILGFLFLVGIFAGFIDTLAGGGGLITLPALVMSGLPPLAALGTNKLQGSVGTAMATLMMLRKKRIVLSQVKTLMLAAFIGSALGAIAVQFINPNALSFVIPAVLIIIVIYFLLAPVAYTAGKEKLSARLYQCIVVPVIGWYDGMFGPGTGSFFGLAGVSLRGQSLIDSTAVAKSLNFSTNVASLVVFMFAGKVIWVVGFAMMAGQAIGAWLGSHYLVSINPKYLRVIVVVMCLAMLARYVATEIL